MVHQYSHMIVQLLQLYILWTATDKLTSSMLWRLFGILFYCQYFVWIFPIDNSNTHVISGDYISTYILDCSIYYMVTFKGIATFHGSFTKHEIFLVFYIKIHSIERIQKQNPLGKWKSRTGHGCGHKLGRGHELRSYANRIDCCVSVQCVTLL